MWGRWSSGLPVSGSPELALAPVEPGFKMVGNRRAPLRDLYHSFLLLSLPAAVVVVALGLLVINTGFALLYLWVGGVANAAPGSFLDAFSFSMQTLCTIGYGAMYPQSDAAKIVSDIEGLSGLMATALATGLLFTRFARPRGALRFTSRVVITSLDGVPTLMFRVGNDRGNLIAEAQARLVMTRTEIFPDGKPFYRQLDLPLVRDRSIHFNRSWTLMHPITPASPLHGLDAARLVADEVEITCAITGVDDISSQHIHARKTWTDQEILFGHRLVDLLRILPDGTVEADVRRFDQVEEG